MLARLWLGVRNVTMIVLFPGTVTVYIPYRILTPIALSRPSQWSFYHYLATIFVLLGVGILLKSVWSFAHVGRGTLAPFDETRKLVVVGLYR